MKPQKNARSSLFLIELMIAVLFFSLGSAVCIQVFVKAHTVNEDARRLSFASLQASSVASALKYTDGSLDSLKEYFPMIAEEEDGLAIYYDKKFKECNEETSFFTLHISREAADRQVNAQIQITAPDRKEPVYTLRLRYPAVSEEASDKEAEEGRVTDHE